ncbi:3-oxo-tetronate kinase [Sinorhizobium sp. BG8]|uniref:3-oxo-tetronate kinase n=1 Tax=Sinorhizobium sp. BG8 TaxID=2613773 RepID=UPI0032B16459
MFKYCSTFDSTPQGNIGPVAEALLDLVGDSLTIACPAFPANGRTVYQGHLFVGDMLLSDSPMRHHPLTPMTDANLVRVLQRQTRRPVGLVPHAVVRGGPGAIADAFRNAMVKGEAMVVVDAITDEDLRAIGEATADMKLITGGSGIAIGLPENYRRTGGLGRNTARAAFAAPSGPAVMLAGSCSAATRRQIETAIAAGVPALKIDPLEVARGTTTAATVVGWIRSRPDAIPLVYSSADPDDVRIAQASLGRDHAGEIVETLLSDVARELKRQGFRRFLVAGGETSGAVVQGLDVRALEIGPEIDPGVPWTRSIGDDEPVALGLKSGNFGADDFFLKAWSMLK